MNVLGYVEVDLGKKKILPYIDKDENGYQLLPYHNWVSNKWCKEVPDTKVDIPETVENETDNINPDHYKRGGIETFDYLKAKMTPVQLEGYLLGNCLKYLSRYQYKNGVEDLRKCEWYVKELVSLKG